MSANLKICIPEATENYIQNPALRYDTTGWNAFGSTISRTLDQARFNIASLQVVTNGTVLREGCYYRVNTLAGISEPITASAYVRGAGNVHIRLIDNPNGKEWVSSACNLRSDRWQRISVSGFSTGSSDMRLYVETDGNTAKAITFYVDGAQMERKPYATTYCDGDQDGCRWNLINHGSNSTRSGTTRAGGKWVPLAGPCRWNDDIYVTVVGGMGMPPLTNNSQSWALNAGSFYQNTKVLDRVITLSFNTKKVNKHLRGKPDISPLHNLRQELIDLIKPDLTAGGEAFLFSYQEGDRELFIRLRYEAGLEGEWDLRNPWINSFPIRFVANDPFFEEDSQEVVGLGFKKTFDVPAGREYDTFRRIDGEWQTWPHLTPGWNGLDDAVYCLVSGTKGEIYAAGIFTGSNLNRVAKWDGYTWNPLGSGSNNTINSLAVAPNGYLYATGSFTSIGGVAANRVAYWNGSAWNALGTGLNDYGTAIIVANNGKVYVTGAFTTAGGITVNRIACWDVGWKKVSSSITGNIGFSAGLAYCFIQGLGDTIYIGGDILDTGSYRAPLWLINTTTNVFSYLYNPSNFGGALTVFCGILGAGGIIYAGGQHLTQNGTSEYTGFIACFSGTGWTQIGNAPAKNRVGSYQSDGIIRTIKIKDNGDLWAGGKFGYIQKEWFDTGQTPLSSDAMESNSLAILRNGKWSGSDISVSKISPPTIYSMLFAKSDDLYIGADNASVASIAAYENMVVNSGTESSHPVVYISGPGVLRWLENQTTNKLIGFTLPILSGEEITIDFGKCSISSTIRGDLSYSMALLDALNSFTLLPGENKIVAFMTDDVNGKMQIRWTPRHWSADASPTPESLGV